EVRPLAGRAADRRGFVVRGHLRDDDARPLLQRRQGPVEVVPAVAEVAAQGDVRDGHAYAPRGAARSWAARSVFCNSMLIVIGPTPPGTGVSADATWRTASKSTSPASLPSG